jgi:hypothetical protein
VEQGFDGTDVRSINVEPLGLDDARRLALDLMGVQDEAAQRVADAIARGSGGSAFFVEDLARSVQAQGLPSNADAFVHDAGATLEQVIEKRVARLDPKARDLLELVATHGRPVATSILREAASVGDEIDSFISALRSHRFVRLVLRDGREAAETMHDRIRETVVAPLSAETLRRHHRRLAEAYEAEPLVDAEAIVGHWFDAQEPTRAAAYAERAAKQASDKLAFDRAAELYQLALSALPKDSEEAIPVRVKLAETLGWAGRGAEAAPLFLDAARTAQPEERMALEQAGANQLLMCGQIQEGTRILRTALARQGRGAPESAWSALLWFLVYTIWLRVIGLRFTARPRDQIPVADRDHLQALYAAVTGLALVDSIVGASLLARFMVTALRDGHDEAVCAAASLGATQLATRGGPEADRERALAQLAADIAEGMPVADRPTRALQGMYSMRCFLRGCWKEAYEAQEAAYTTTQRSRETWNSHAVAVYAEFALGFLGEPAELAKRLPALLADAERRGDRLKVVNLRTGVAPLVHLANDDPDGARRQVVSSMAQWPQPGFLIQHWRAMIAEVDIHLYEDKGALAYEGLARLQRAYRRSMLAFAQYVRAITAFARARCAVASVRRAPSYRRKRLHEAARIGSRLEQEGMPWIGVLASLVAAGVANAEGRPAGASIHLRTAVDRANATGMALHEAAARHRLGTLLGGDEGQKLVQEAEKTMRIKGVEAPARYAAMILPGQWEPSVPPHDKVA